MGPSPLSCPSGAGLSPFPFRREGKELGQPSPPPRPSAMPGRSYKHFLTLRVGRRVPPSSPNKRSLLGVRPNLIPAALSVSWLAITGLGPPSLGLFSLGNALLIPPHTFKEGSYGLVVLDLRGLLWG